MTAEKCLFGPLLCTKVEPKPRPRQEETSAPSCVVAVSPMDGCRHRLRVAKAECRSLEWWLANSGSTKWPEDMVMSLVHRSPGLIVGTDAALMQVPPAQPYTTVQVIVAMLMPSKEGPCDAKWTVTSPSYPSFCRTLSVEFDVIEQHQQQQQQRTSSPAVTGGAGAYLDQSRPTCTATGICEFRYPVRRLILACFPRH